MTLPAAYATISMGDINVELGRARTSSISLNTAEDGGYGAINTNSSSRPSASDPAALSEWYSYNHSAAPARSISFSNYTSLGYTGSVSGTVTIVGTYTFQAAAALYYGGGTVSANININGNTRFASRGGASGTNYSTTFTLSTGTYSYSLSTTVSSGSGGSGYINAY